MAWNVKATRTAAVASGRSATFQARVALAACGGNKTLSERCWNWAACL